MTRLWVKVRGMGREPVQIVLLGDVNEGSPNRRLHWRTRHAIDQRWKENAWGEWASIGCPAFPGKVRVSFIAYRFRAIDYCNLHGSRCLKAVVDGLKGRCFVDDDPKHLEWGEVKLVTSPEYRGRPVLLVTIEEINDDAG